MKLFDHNEVLQIRLAMDGTAWDKMMSLDPLRFANNELRASDLHDLEYLGLTTEGFDREEYFTEPLLYGQETQFGNIIAVYTFYDNYRDDHQYALPWAIAYRNGRVNQSWVQKFPTKFRRDEELAKDQPFQDQGMYF